MTRASTAKLYIGGFVIWLIGVVIVFGSMAASQGSNQPGAGAAIGYILAAAGGLAMLVGWIFALIRTAQAKRWGWFIALLVLGLIGLQIIVMAAYLIAGPREGESLTRPSPA